MAWLIVFVRPRTVRSSQGLTDVTASHARLDNLPLGSLTYARELLDAEELAHAGRTAKPRTRGDGDAR
jgi:hypothetical protein